MLLAVLGAIATLGILVYTNRNKINTLMNWAFGLTGEQEGVHGQLQETVDRLERIESKLDQEADDRRREHKEAQKRIERNRYMLVESLHSLIEAMDENLDEDIDVDFPVEREHDYWRTDGEDDD